MKWVFVLALVCFAPALAALLRSNRRYLVPTCFALGASIMLLGPSLWTAPIAWPSWPSPIIGVQVSIVDAFSVALFASTRSVRIPWSIKLSFGIVCIAVLLSIIVAYQWMPAFFYAWQLLRAAVLFIAVARVCVAEPRCQIALIAGLAAGLICEPVFVVLQHMQGVERPGGTFGHSNFLGVVVDFIVPPALALLLGSRRWIWPGLAVVAACICAVLGESRATMGIFVMGVLLTVVLSIAHKRSSRKFAFTGVLIVLLLASAPAMIWSAGQRSQQTLASSDYERAAMKEAARMMIADHPFGVGANQYAMVAIMSGYSARAGVAWNEGNRRAPVHNTYYLVTAELGFVGLIGLLAMLGSVIALGVSGLRRHLPDDTGELVPGLLASTIIVSAHIAFEFAFMDQNLHYLFATSAGMIVAIWARAQGRRSAAGSVPIGPAALSHAT